MVGCMVSGFGRFDLGIVVCKHLIEDGREVRLVTHYADGDWAFSCGETDHAEAGDNEGVYRLIHIGHILSEDTSLEDVADLLPGWSAERGRRGETWRRYEDPA